MELTARLASCRCPSALSGNMTCGAHPAPASHTHTTGGLHTESIHRLAADHAASEPPPRRRMPTERRSLTHKFCADGHEGYLTAGLYDDGTVGELFITSVARRSLRSRPMGDTSPRFRAAFRTPRSKATCC